MRKTLIFLTIVFRVFSLQAQTDWCGFSGTLDSSRKDTAKFEAFRKHFATGLNQFRSQQGPFHISNPPSPCFSCFTTGSSCAKATYILPIVVHVIHLQGDTVIGKGSNISYAQIRNAIERLNEAFRNASNSPPPAVNTGIQFCLARVDYNGDTFSGINRICSNTLSNWKTNQLSALTALGQYFTADNYINVYIVNRILDPSGNFQGVLGKSTFPYNAAPDIQGVIIAHDFFGDYRTIGSPLDTNSLGLVFPHEIGHYLGLYHPFDFSCTGINDKNCSTDGDLCCDVPAVDGKNQNCSMNWNTCKNENYNGFDPDDQKENYMDYSDEHCKTTFTEDQTGLMHYTLERFRPGLIDPALTNNLQMKCCLFSAIFNGEDFGCDSVPISMIAVKYTNSVTYRWQFFKGNTVKYIYTRNSEKLTNISLDTGIYTVKLTVTDGNDSVSWSRKKWLKIADCSNKLKSTSSNWFFGVQAGVKFYKSGVFRDIEYQRQEKNLFNHQPDPGEGTLSVSDTGNLLFYGGNDNNYGSENYMDSFRIYDKKYNHMKGSPIVAWNNATQPIVCINIPDSTKKYYVISNINTRLNLNVIDLNKTSVTVGEITRKHVPILLPSWLAGNDTRHLEALTAIQHCDGKNYWLLSHAKHNDTPMILVFKVINTGITYNGRILTPAWRSQSTMKFSPNGRWLSIENALYLFDRKNGTAELYKNHVNANSDAFSAAFSPNSNYLYRYERNFVSPFNTPLYQYDLTSTDNYLSRQKVTEVYGDLSLQNGPDSCIYFANFASQDFLSAIVKPNEKLNGADNACIYLPDHVKLNNGDIGGYAQTGLPQFVNALPSNKVIPDFIATIEDCKTVRFIVNQCCIANKITWEFGDGYFGTGLDTIHTYSTTGNYSIKMKWGNDSVIHNVLLGINPSDLLILGDTSICDTAKTIYYQTPKHKSDYLYKWDARTDGTSSNDAEYELNSTEVKWKRSGYLYLAVFDNRTGCQDSVKIHISANNSIINNHIDSNQFVCDTTQINQLIGSNPTGGTGTYAYQWFYRQNGTNTWKFATGLTSKNAIPIKKDSSFQYYREVTSGTCLSKSNVIHVNIASDYSALEKGGTCKGKIYVKNRPLSSLSGYSIQWQESFDSVTWINITGATGDTLTVNNTILRKWFRQKLSKGICVVYSPRIQKGDLTITTQPTDAVSCGAIPFNLRTKAQSTVGFNIKYSWQYLTNDNNWKSLVGNSNDSLVQQVNWPNYRTFNCKITSYCGTQNSRNATVGAYSAPFVIYTNLDTTVSSNSSVTFNGKWSGERNTCYVVWQKSRCPFGCQWDSIGKTSNNTYTTTPIFNDCQRKTYYRFTLRNLCPIDTIRAKKFWNNKYTSKTFEAGSYQLPNYQADLWIPDTYRDTGLEPNMVDINAYTGSYKLWNRLHANKFVAVNDWTDRTAVKTDADAYGDTNFIHVKVYNRGNISSSSTGNKLFLYWTVNSTNEDWPSSWTGLQMKPNYDSAKSGGGYKKFPVGGRINKTGITIPSIPAGGSTVITYAWRKTDTIPQPGWYYDSVGGQHVYSNEIGMCLLARIQTCDSPSFGISYPEKLNYSTNWKTAASNGNLQYNVVYNNNIVSSNFYVSYVKPPFTSYVQNWTLGGLMKKDDGGGIHNGKMTFKLCADTAMYFNNSEVLITLPDDYWAYFNTQGSPGSGFVSPATNQLIVNTKCATIGPITVPDTFHTSLGLTWRYKDGTGPGNINRKILFTLTETQDDTVETGRLYYSIEGNYSTTSGEGGGIINTTPSADEKTLENKSFNNSERKFIVTPNPFNDYLNILFRGIPNTKVKIELYNTNGSLVKVISNSNADSEGKISIFTKTENLAPGTYIIKATENGKAISETVIRCQ